MGALFFSYNIPYLRTGTLCFYPVSKISRFAGLYPITRVCVMYFVLFSFAELVGVSSIFSAINISPVHARIRLLLPEEQEQF